MKALLLTCGRSEGAFAKMARVSGVAARIMPVDIYSLDTQPLEEFSALLIGMHVDQRFLAARGRRLDQFLERGNTVTVNADRFPGSRPHVGRARRNRRPYLGARCPMVVAPDQFLVVAGERRAAPHKIVRPEHDLFRFVPFEDTVWHFHGVLFPPPGADALIVVPADPDGRDDGGALLYDDRVTTRGRIIVSTLDPFYHHGSNFMPATTRFLDGFLPWARANAAI